MSRDARTGSIRFSFIRNVSMILSIGTLVLCIAVAAYEGTNRYDTLCKKGYAFASFVAKLAQDPLIMQDTIQLDSIVNEMDNEDVLYTVVTDASGSIVTSQFASLNYKSARLLRIKNAFARFDDLKDILAYIKGNEATVEVSVPIVTGAQTIGHATIGLSKTRIIASTIKTALFVACINIGIALVIGIVLFRSSERVLLKPISLLAHAANRVAEGDLSTRLDFPAVGEMGMLRESFNRMTEDLQRTTVSREYVNGIIASMAEALVVLAPDRTIRDVNDAAVTLFGYRRDELVGMNAAAIFAESLLPSGAAGEEGQHVISSETSCRRKDGAMIPIYFSSSRLPGGDGAAQGIVCCVLDITEIKNVSRELAEANAELIREVEQRTSAQDEVNRLNDNLLLRTRELERVVSELESFSYSVSHDLRAPLRGIDGFSNALLEDYGDRLDPVARDYLSRIRNGCTRMGRLIDDLLRLSRITRAEIRRVRINMSDVVRSIAEELRRADPGREVDIQVADGVVGYADPVLIRSVLENLVGNAWKFTRATEQARICFGTCEERGETVFFVRDNGAGFDMTYADKLFGAFQRLHSNTEFEGSGIGLASVKRIIHRHGGRVWAHAAEGEGATFYFTLGGTAYGEKSDLAG